MKYFESDVPTGNGLCSDNECPCPEVAIPRGTGYIYIDQSLVDFRSRYPKLAEARNAMQQQFQQNQSALEGTLSMFYRLGPILMCEKAARLRGLNLKIAAVDAKHWWETGQVPLRTTPTADSQFEEGHVVENLSTHPIEGNNAEIIPIPDLPASHNELNHQAVSIDQCFCEKGTSSDQFLCDNCGRPIGWEPVIFRYSDDYSDLHCDKCTDIRIPKAASYYLDMLGRSIPCPLCGTILQVSSAGFEPWDLSIFEGSEHLTSEESLLNEVNKLSEAAKEDLKPEALAEKGMLPVEIQLAGRLILSWLEKTPNLTEKILNAAMTNWAGHITIGMLSNDGFAKLSAEQKEGFFVIMHYASALLHQLDNRVEQSKFGHGMRGSLIINLMTCYPDWKNTPFNNLHYDGRLGIEELAYTLKKDKDAYPDDSKKAGSWAQFEQALNSVIPKADQAKGCREDDVRGSQKAKDKKCFVATAAYSTDAAQVKILRRFRDNILTRSELGRAFIGWYNNEGPKLASYIMHKPFLRMLCRIFLCPFVLGAKFLLFCLG